MADCVGTAAAIADHVNIEMTIDFLSISRVLIFISYLGVVFECKLITVAFTGVSDRRLLKLVACLDGCFERLIRTYQVRKLPAHVPD
jgi:hypothetical protein